MEDIDPIVSVITPTYNRAGDLSRAIRSVLEQTYPYFEHIVVDDGSTDNTASIVNSYDNDNIRFIRLEENQGANTARNIGIKEADGKYISFLDSDDEYVATRLERIVNLLQQQPDRCGGAYHSYRIIQNDDILTVNHAQDGEIGLDSIKDGNTIGGFSATIFRKDVFDNVGYLDENMPSSQDYEFYLRVLDKYYMIGIDEILANYHRSSDSISFDIGKREKAERYLLKKHGDKLSSKRKANHHYGRAILYARNNEMEDAKRELSIAFQIYPWKPLYIYHYIAMSFGKKVFQISEDLKLYFKNLLTE